jgi:hypothetical protein
MATRFYLPSSGAAAVSPAIDAGWELQVSSFARLATSTVKQSTAMAYTVDTNDGDLADKDKCCRQWVSEPIAAQTIAAQTVEFQIRCAEENSANNLFLALGLRVVSNDGSTVRGTLLAVTRDGLEMVVDGNLDGSSNWVNRRLSATTTQVVAQDGDRIVIEAGGGGDPSAGSAHRHGLRIGDAAASDLAEDDTSTTDDNPWLEFPNDLTFQGAGGSGNATRAAHGYRQRRA